MEVVGEHLSSIMELLEANVTSDQQQLASAEMVAAEQRQVGQLSPNISLCMALPSQRACLRQSSHLDTLAMVASQALHVHDVNSTLDKVHSCWHASLWPHCINQ